MGWEEIRWRVVLVLSTASVLSGLSCFVGYVSVKQDYRVVLEREAELRIQYQSCEDQSRELRKDLRQSLSWSLATYTQLEARGWRIEPPPESKGE